MAHRFGDGRAGLSFVRCPGAHPKPGDRDEVRRAFDVEPCSGAVEELFCCRTIPIESVHRIILTHAFFRGVASSCRFHDNCRPLKQATVRQTSSAAPMAARVHSPWCQPPEVSHWRGRLNG